MTVSGAHYYGGHYFSESKQLFIVKITDGNSFKSKFPSRFSSLPGFNIIDQVQTSNFTCVRVTVLNKHILKI